MQHNKLFISLLFCLAVSLLSGCAEKPPQTYTDTEYGFSFVHPGNWWKKSDAASHLMLLGYSESGYHPNINISLLDPIPEIFLFAMQKEQFKESFEEGGFKNMKIIDYDIKQIGGKNALFSHFQATVDEGAAKGMALEVLLYLFQHEEKTFRIMLCCRQDKIEKNRPIFDSIISSFKFEGMQDEPPQEPEEEPEENAEQ